jgi:hypothetical protein
MALLADNATVGAPVRGDPAIACELRIACSQQPQAPKACVPLAADHKMVVDRDAERFRGRLDFLGHLDVVARRLGVARRMVVRQDQRRRC